MDVVSVALNLLPAGFVSGLGVASGAAKKFGKDVASDFDAPKEKLGALGTAGLVMGGAVVAGFGLAIHSTLEFDKNLSELGATVGATDEQMGALRDKAMQLGADTAFSASEAAAAMVELGKQGLTTQEIMGGAADATVALAAAGGVALPQAATIASAAMTQFHLSAEELPHVADLLAGAANASAASVDGLGTALGYVGPVAAAAGLSIDDTTAALALLSSGGLDASTTGTALRSILTNLQPTTAKATAAFKELGLTTEDGSSKFFDVQGKILPLNGILDVLRGTFGGLTEQQKLFYTDLLFGREALSAVNIMAGTTDEQFQDLQRTLAETSAAEVAAEKMDNLAGDLEALKGSIETALIEGGSKATSALRGMAEGATTMVNGLSGMPDQLQWVVLGFTALVGLGAGVGGISIKVAELSQKLQEMGSLGQMVGNNLGAMTLATAGVTLAIAGFAYAQGVAAREQAANDATTQSLTQQLIAQTGAVDAVTDAWLRKQFAEGQRDNIGETLVDTNANLDILTRGIREQGTALDEWRDHIFNTGEGWGYLEDKLRAAAGSGDAMSAELLRLVDSGQITGDQAVQLVRDFDFLNDRFDEASGKAQVNATMTAGLGDAALGAAPKVDEFGNAIEETGTSSEKAKTAWEAYQDSIKATLDPLFGYQSAMLGVRDAQASYDEAVLKVIDATNQHGESSVEAAEAQRELERAELDLGQSALDTDVAMRQLKEGLDNGTISTEQYKATLQRWVGQGIVTQAQADALAWSTGLYVGQLNTIPADKFTTISLDVSQALAASDAYLRKLIDIDNLTGGNNVANYFNNDPNAPKGGALGGAVSPMSVRELHDTPHPEVYQEGGRTFLFAGASGGSIYSATPGAHLPFPSYPVYPSPSFVGGAGGGGTVVHAPVHVKVELNWPHYLGNGNDKAAAAREITDLVEPELVRRLDSLSVGS